MDSILSKDRATCHSLATGTPSPETRTLVISLYKEFPSEVVDIMRTNVEKVLERDQKLSQLDDRADVLQAGASQFEASAGKLKRKFWMKNIKNSSFSLDPLTL
ncbi:hypothetical protein CRM22_009708 [Opisthorchis felineus]|uniref:V-SNARE coiled-coil homology domain-containing protein n=1 Tax=Opisthorchis felineus TaxID=147828 RepID=A0A4S2L642_OPIFE|nr:hypothetical protein CRM22_009708 [Opisthorchis felineus]